MLVVRVELWSAVTGKKTEIARAVIANDGTGTTRRGNYWAKSMRGRDEEALQASMVSILTGKTKPVHEGVIENHDRLGQHVWVLVAKALTAMGYGK